VSRQRRLVVFASVLWSSSKYAALRSAIESLALPARSSALLPYTDSAVFVTPYVKMTAAVLSAEFRDGQPLDRSIAGTEVVIPSTFAIPAGGELFRVADQRLAHVAGIDTGDVLCVHKLTGRESSDVDFTLVPMIVAVMTGELAWRFDAQDKGMHYYGAVSFSEIVGSSLARGQETITLSGTVMMLYAVTAIIKGSQQPRKEQRNAE
jgi:hypothetical protein